MGGICFLVFADFPDDFPDDSPDDFPHDFPLRRMAALPLSQEALEATGISF